MGLAIQMQIIAQRCDYVNPYHCERGGILSLTTLSGIQYAVYEFNPNENTVPLGLMQHDQESVELCKELPPWRYRRAYPEFSSYPYLITGEVITNAVFPDIDPSTVMAGAPIYLAPSGLITSTTQFSHRKIGTFLSTLNQGSLQVPAELGPSILRVGGKESLVNPEPILVSTAGWVKIKIDIT